jgi:hypothetical protein
MAKPIDCLDSNLQDPFEPYHASVRANQRLSRLCFMQAGVIALLVLALVYGVALRPMRVIVKDRASAEMPMLSVTDAAPIITPMDARVFFVHMLQLRYGWDSAHVAAQFKDLLGLSAAPYRNVVTDYLSAPYQADEQTADAPTSVCSRLEAWRQAREVHTLAFVGGLQDVDCRTQDDDLWHCRVRGAIKTENLAEPNRPQAPVRVTFTGTLMPVPHTYQTPSGLVVQGLDILHHKEATR